MLREDEWRTYVETPEELADSPMKPYYDQVGWAEGLVFVYPTWQFSLPAMLKGWLDRVFVPGAAFSLLAPGQRTPSSLVSHIRLVAGVTSTGMPGWALAVADFPGKRLLRRAIRLGFALRCENIWLCLHGIDKNTREQRARHLERVERRFARVRGSATRPRARRRVRASLRRPVHFVGT